MHYVISPLRDPLKERTKVRFKQIWTELKKIEQTKLKLPLSVEPNVELILQTANLIRSFRDKKCGYQCQP